MTEKKTNSLSIAQLGIAVISLATTAGFLYSHLKAEDAAHRDSVDERPSLEAQQQRESLDSAGSLLNHPPSGDILNYRRVRGEKQQAVFPQKYQKFVREGRRLIRVDNNDPRPEATSSP